MKKILAMLLGLLPLLSNAQQTFDFRQMQDVKVVVAGDTLANAWAGGLNAPLFSKIQLNADNVEDLYVFDRNSNKSFTFLADNSSGTWRWKYAPEFEALFPVGLKDWVLLRDYDGDGRKDIFTSFALDYFVYRNITPLNGKVTFGSRRTLKYGNFNSGFDFDSYTLPSLTDVDNDGDLDMLVFESGGTSTINFFKNQSKELYNHSDSLKFIKSTSIWGNLRRCFDSHTYAFNGISCRVAGTMHASGSSLLAIDLDADGDKDLLSGLELAPELARFTNSGTNLSPAFSGFSLAYPSSGNPANFVNYPTPYSEDVTFDGKKDLLVAPFLHDNSDKADLNHSVWLYRNDAFSPNASPVFTFQQPDFLQNQMIDVGESAAPVFFDIDADGDQDLLVSNYADYRQGSGIARFKSTVSLFTNTGTLTKPVFHLTNTDYLNFSAADNNAGYKGIKLQFIDMDGNGSRDMIIRYLDASGSLALVGYIPHSGQSGNPFTRANMVDIDIDLNTTDSPFFYDLDSDGDADILLGTAKGSNGVLHFIRRVGANVSQASAWDINYNTNVGNIPIAGNPAFFNPTIADLNNDYIPELITGDNSGEIRIYPDFLANINGTLVAQTNLVYNDLLNQNLASAFGNLNGFNSRVNLHLAAADLDGDTKPELITGTISGGLVYLKNQSVLGIGKEKAAKDLQVQVFPNPATEIVTISCEKEITISVFDITGRAIHFSGTAFSNVQQLSVSGLKNGIYFLKAVTKTGESSGRKIIIQH